MIRATEATLMILLLPRRGPNRVTRADLHRGAVGRENGGALRPKARMTPSQGSSLARSRRGRLYSTQPSYFAKPSLAKTGSNWCLVDLKQRGSGSKDRPSRSAFRVSSKLLQNTPPHHTFCGIEPQQASRDLAYLIERLNDCPIQPEMIAP